jgi:two-component system cell cycle response regulator DivK
MAKAKILVIEDNPDNLQLVVFLLERAGYEVLKAIDGRQGLEVVNLHKPNLVLIDLSIPEIDGWTLAQEIKSHPETAKIVLVALTAHTLPGDRKRALDAGCNGYISKPLDVRNFVSQVELLLSGRQPERHGTGPLPPLP